MNKKIKLFNNYKLFPLENKRRHRIFLFKSFVQYKNKNTIKY